MLTARFDDAVSYASALHRTQVRKESGVPYVAHLLAVAASVLESGEADEDVAIAALLHDAIEDQGVTALALASRYGDRVASIVVECTDTDQVPKPPWRPRKEAYVARLETASRQALLVTAADKLHNVRSMLRDLRVSGPSMWDRFSAGPADQLWYHRAVADVLTRRLGGSLADELRRAVDALAAAVSA